MFDLLKQLLASGNLSQNPLVAPAIFLILLLVLRFFFISFVWVTLKRLSKDDRKKVRQEYRQRALMGWILWGLSWAVLVIAYFDMIPQTLQNEIVAISACVGFLVISLSLHYLAYAQAALCVLEDRKNSGIQIVS